MRSGMGFNSRSQPPTESTEATTPYAHWPFASIDGDEDISGHGYDATLAGHANTDCDILQLDGTGDCANLDAHVSSFTGLRTGAISLWFYPTAINKVFFALTHGAGALSLGSFYLAYTATKRIQLYCYGVLNASGHPALSRSLDLHRWHHLCYVSDATGNYFYIDGELETNMLYSAGSSSTQCFLADATIATAPDTMRIGHVYYNGSGQGEWAGGIRDVRIFNKAPTHAEALELYNAGGNRFLHADEVFGACRIFEVQHEYLGGGWGDGLYDCYAQTLDATEWDDTTGGASHTKTDDVSGTTEYVVLNLAEFYNEPVYVSPLAAGDLLLGFRHWDDEAGFCWVGIPFRKQGQGQYVRRAYAAADAGASTTLAGYLDDWVTPGTSITINFHRAQGDSANLNVCSPRFKQYDPMLVYKEPSDGKWYCTTVLQPTKDCDCYSAP
jgi:hypothetical protein